MKSLLTLVAFTLSFGLLSQNILAEHHFEDSGIEEVSISGVFCDVNVTSGDLVIFDGLIEGKGDEGDYVIASIRNGNTVVFKVERKKERDWGWNEIDVARLNLKIPVGTVVKIENTSGDVSVSVYDAEVLTVSATSGDVLLRDIKSDAKVKSTSGDIDVRGLQGNLSMRSTSGDQELVDLVGNLRTESTSGDIKVSRLIGSLDVSATSGDIELNEIEGSVSASTTSGNTEGERVFLTGDSRFKSTSGDIEISLKNDLEEIGFDLRATSGDLEVGSIDGDDRLVLRRGKLQLTGISTSGDQSYTN